MNIGLLLAMTLVGVLLAVAGIIGLRRGPEKGSWVPLTAGQRAGLVVVGLAFIFGGWAFFEGGFDINKPSPTRVYTETKIDHAVVDTTLWNEAEVAERERLRSTVTPAAIPPQTVAMAPSPIAVQPPPVDPPSAATSQPAVPSAPPVVIAPSSRAGAAPFSRVADTRNGAFGRVGTAANPAAAPAASPVPVSASAVAPNCAAPVQWESKPRPVVRKRTLRRPVRVDPQWRSADVVSVCQVEYQYGISAYCAQLAR